jgi:hypothetical protein
LQKAFDATLRDPALLAEAETRGLTIRPIAGTDVRKIIDSLLATPQDVIAAVKYSAEVAKPDSKK